MRAADFTIALNSLPANWTPYQNYFVESKVIDYDPYFLNECIDQILIQSPFTKTIESEIIEIHTKLLKQVIRKLNAKILQFTSVINEEASKQLAETYSNYGPYRVLHIGFVSKDLLTKKAKEGMFT